MSLKNVKALVYSWNKTCFASMILHVIYKNFNFLLSYKVLILSLNYLSFIMYMHFIIAEKYLLDFNYIQVKMDMQLLQYLKSLLVVAQLLFHLKSFSQFLLEILRTPETTTN